jgi:hypothetical protein
VREEEAVAHAPVSSSHGTFSAAKFDRSCSTVDAPLSTTSAHGRASAAAGFAAIPSDEEEHYPDPDPEPESVAGFGPDGPVIPPVLYEYDSEMNEDYPDPDPAPEPVTLPFPEPDPVDVFVAETVTKYADKLSVQPEPVDDDYVDDDGSEGLEEEEAADGFFEDDGDEEVNEYMAK